MGVGMAIARTVVGKALLGVIVAAIFVYILPSYNLGFYEIWLLVTILGILIGVIMWVLMPDRDHVQLRGHGK